MKIISHKTKFLGALFLGTAAFAGSSIYFRRAEQKIHAQLNMTSVLVAKKYISQGKLVPPEAVEKVAIPTAYLQPTALQSVEDLAPGEGGSLYKARIGFLKGEQITRSKLADEKSSLGLAWILPVETSAVTLRLEPSAAVGGHIQPGDAVNVLVAFDPQPGIPEPRVEVIMAHVPVMGVQDQLWDPAAGLVEKKRPLDLSNDSILVTLAVTMEQAARLTLASTRGHMRLALESVIKPEQFKAATLQLSQL